MAFEVTLPELFTVSSQEYEALHGVWLKAVKVLPDYTVVHKQDIFVQEQYRSDIGKDDLSFLSRSFERHFNERPFLHHTCYLFITKTTRAQSRRQSDCSVLCRGTLVPKELQDKDTTTRFLEAVEQFASIVRESGHIRLRRLGADEIAGNSRIFGNPRTLSHAVTVREDPVAGHASLIPTGCGSATRRCACIRFPIWTTSPAAFVRMTATNASRPERSDCRLSFAAPVGLLLSCNHIYNQYLFLDNSDENLRQFERTARNMQSLAQYSRSNQINKEWIDDYLNEAHSFSLTSIRAHFNVMAWGEGSEELKQIRNDVGAQLALMGCTPRHNTVDVPTLFWAAIPGNEGDFPAEESFYTFLEQGLCLFNEETNYRSSLSPFGIKMADRVSGIPIHLDISDYPMKKGWISNRNRVVIGPSGGGKSFILNHICRQYYEQGAHIVIVDTGNSYQGLCSLIRQKTKGRDGIYFTYQEDAPVAFNPFFVEDGVYDVEKRESLKALLLTLWKRESEEPTRAEEVALSNAVNLYLSQLKTGTAVTPSFNTFYEFVATDYRRLLEKKRVREKDFDIENFLNVLEPYYRGGEYDYLLNSDKQLDLLDKRFIVFELDNISENKVLYPVITLIIMETFLTKMRRLKGIRKVLLLEEAWKAIAKAGMAGFIKYLYKTCRKYFGECMCVTQELDDLLSSPVLKESVIANCDCRILLDMRKYANKFDEIQELLGLSDKERNQVLSINRANHPKRCYKEVWIGLGGVHSAVYATETSLEEYLCYTTEETEKLELATSHGEARRQYRAGHTPVGRAKTQ